LFIVKNGNGIHTINHHDYTYQKGTVFTLRKGVTHKFSESDSEADILVFTEDFIIKHLGETEGIKTLRLFNELIESPKIQLNETFFLEVKTILEQLNNESKLKNDTYTSSIKRSLLHILISKLFREKIKDKEAITNTKYLNQFLKFQNLIEKQWYKNKTALDYAKQLAVTPKTLNNIVKATIKKSAKSLIDDIVTTQIKHLLINTELSITEIAYQSGFNDPTNFFKYFKKNTTLSPAQFREAHK
tara:strand:- start:6689 stop:7420 length:732 start_codon:yes stop_codon:yes gene_type:complete